MRTFGKYTSLINSKDNKLYIYQWQEINQITNFLASRYPSDNSVKQAAEQGQKFSFKDAVLKENAWFIMNNLDGQNDIDKQIGAQIFLNDGDL